jgi:hypothetical protein
MAPRGAKLAADGGFAFSGYAPRVRAPGDGMTRSRHTNGAYGACHGAQISLATSFTPTPEPPLWGGFFLIRARRPRPTREGRRVQGEGDHGAQAEAQPNDAPRLLRSHPTLRQSPPLRMGGCSSALAVIARGRRLGATNACTFRRFLDGRFFARRHGIRCGALGRRVLAITARRVPRNPSQRLAFRPYASPRHRDTRGRMGSC